MVVPLQESITQQMAAGQLAQRELLHTSHAGVAAFANGTTIICAPRLGLTRVQELCGMIYGQRVVPACDLIEPMRPVVDRFVIKLFRTKTLRPDHFSDQQGACHLGKAGRSIFYAAWAQFVPLPRRSIRRGIRVLKHALRQQP